VAGVTELVRFTLDGGGAVTVELDEEPGIAPAGRGNVLREAKSSFEKALVEVRDAATAALGEFQRMTRRPDAVEIKFGVKLDAQAGAVIAKTGVQGQFEVKLTWQAPAASDATGPAASTPNEPAADNNDGED
jgi:Trypsin-co-occurring domain 1